MRKVCFLLSALAALLLTSPAHCADLLPASRPIHDAIDHYVGLPLEENKIQPAPLADDATLLRRLTLDLVGRIPTVAELEAYVRSTEADKKARVVDRLMASSGFLRHHVNELDAMLSNATPVGTRRSDSLREYSIDP